MIAPNRVVVLEDRPPEERQIWGIVQGPAPAGKWPGQWWLEIVPRAQVTSVGDRSQGTERGLSLFPSWLLWGGQQLEELERGSWDIK